MKMSPQPELSRRPLQRTPSASMTHVWEQCHGGTRWLGLWGNRVGLGEEPQLSDHGSSATSLGVVRGQRTWELGRTRLNESELSFWSGVYPGLTCFSFITNFS